MKISALVLACYVLLLSFLPAIGASSGYTPAKKSCMQCCKKKSKSIPNKDTADKELSNPFFGCSACAALLAAEFNIQVNQQLTAFTAYSAKVQKLYHSPHFDFWHPPRLV
ncbi:hypothetical protein [Dyadobacter psychrophilus]|uniref:hypothetical protein n=1 Tax=Dyadobacter psychrophilus TaxID=651661 RepID=UPI0009E30C2E|nr:hypothetical protein [Dyadobacter psychrophilus]